MAADDVVLERKEKQNFHIPEFDGPLDLLLFLIQKNEVNIYNIPVALITEQFLQYISEHETELEEKSSFYKMAADLLYIKSRMLLPVTTELDEEYEDPRAEIVDKLIEYQKYRKYTDLLLGIGTEDRLYIQRPENYFAVPFEDKELFEGVDLQTLLDTFARIISRKGIVSSKVFNIYEEVNESEKKALIEELLEDRKRITLEDVIQHPESIMHIVCSFLAILQMAKDRLIVISQDDDSIYIEKRDEDWDPEKADEYDREYDIVVEKGLEDPDDFSILTDEAETRIREEEKGSEEDEFIGDEEFIDLEDD